jgi:hypothetical protein
LGDGFPFDKKNGNFAHGVNRSVFIAVLLASIGHQMNRNILIGKSL